MFKNALRAGAMVQKLECFTLIHLTDWDSIPSIPCVLLRLPPRLPGVISEHSTRSHPGFPWCPPNLKIKGKK